MKAYKKWISALLALSMMLFVFPVFAGAEEPEETEPIVFQPGTVIYKNPLYSGSLDVTALPDASAVMPLAEDIVYYSDTAEAAAVLREGMKNRQNLVTIGFQLDVSADASQIVNSIVDQALAHTRVPTEGDYLQWQLGYISFGGGGYIMGSTAYYTLQFEILYYTDAEQEAVTDAAVASLLASLELDGLSDYEKVCAVYQWMCSNIAYDYGNLNDNTYMLKYTAYAALVNRTSVCQGYALLFYRLMLELGIDCRVVTGIGNGGPHAWNIVKLDGEYYNVDATFDTSYYQVLGIYNFFLRCDATFEDHSRDPEYSSAGFYAAYPMASEDYDPAAHPQKIPGDINDDGAVNNKDVTRLFQYQSNWDVTVNENALDVNGDGSVNNKDLTRLFQYVSGWDVEIY